MKITGSRTVKAAAVAVILVSLLSVMAFGQSKYDRLLSDEQGRAKLVALASMVKAGYLDDRIRSLVTDPDPLVRLRCAEVLGQIDDPQGTIYFLARLSGDSDPEVVKAAVYSLGLAGHREKTEQMTLESIEKVLKAGSADQKKMALRALGLTRLTSASKLIVPYLRNFSSSIREEAAISLTATGDSAAAAELMPSLHDPDMKVVAAAIYAAGRLGYKKASGKLIALLTNDDPAVRMRAVESLGRLQDDKSIDFIAKVMGDTDRAVAIKAAEALVRIGNDQAADKLAGVLKSDDPYIKTLALQGIAASKRKKLFKDVVPLLDDESVMVRRAAIVAVSATDEDKARDHLLRMYREGNHYDRMTALEQLGMTGKSEDLVLLVSVLDSKADHFSREGAATGLGRWPEPGQLLEDTGSGRRPVDALIEAANGDDWVVATICVESLGKTVPAEVVDQLIELFHRSSGRLDSDIKMTVITALGPLARKEDPASETRGKIVKLLKSALKEADPRIPGMAAKQGEYLGLKFIPDPLLARDWDRGIDPEEEPVLPMGLKRIALVTGKGRIEIVLFGDEAPAMVHSFLKLSGEGFYKGLNFHRVVPGFVVQGGCPRGDGWGDAGFFLRSEINAHRYERGAMGVAHAGKDTPGSQFFLTHVPQPHLDGRYTVIGRIEKGLEIIDHIEIGDTIDIRVLD